MPKKSKRSMSSRAGARGAAPTTNEFNPDYTYVKRDLARIGVLAGSFFAILIVLSFFLR
ncbi:MAG: hypothetical protein ACM3QS_09000 [Bacteroidota bacterium]